MVDNHLLRVFVAISRTGNVARAADLLQLTPSPVSRSLRELERQTGTLFERAYHDMRLLPRGEELLPAAVSALQLAEDFSDLAAGRSPMLRVAASPWVANRFVDAFNAAIAECGLEMEEHEGAVSAELLSQLRHGEVDAVLVHMPVDFPGISSRALGAYRFEVLAPADDPLLDHRRDGGVEIEAIAGRRVFIFPVSMQPTPAGGLKSWLERAGAGAIEEMDLAEAHTLPMKLRRAGAITVTVAGDDVAFRYPEHKLVRIPIEGAQPLYQIGLAWRDVNPSRMAAITSIEDRLVAQLRPDTPAAPVVGT